MSWLSSHCYCAVKGPLPLLRLHQPSVLLLLTSDDCIIVLLSVTSPQAFVKVALFARCFAGQHALWLPIRAVDWTAVAAVGSQATFRMAWSCPLQGALHDVERQW